MSIRHPGSAGRLLLASIAGLGCALVLLVGATLASAAPSTWWRMSSRPAPTYLPPEAKEAKVDLTALREGRGDAEGRDSPRIAQRVASSEQADGHSQAASGQENGVGLDPRMGPV